MKAYRIMKKFVVSLSAIFCLLIGLSSLQAADQIQEIINALNERYRAVTNETIDVQNYSGNFSTLTDTQKQKLIKDIIDNCVYTVSLYRQAGTPDSAFLEVPDIKDVELSQALQIALDYLKQCRYVHIGPGGLSLPLKSGEVRRIDIGRATINPPLDVQWFNSAYAPDIGSMYDRKNAITTDDVYVLSLRTIGEIQTSAFGGPHQYGTGFEYGFSITYDLSAWRQAPAQPFYSITWYSGLGNSTPTDPLWPYISGHEVKPPFWIPFGTDFVDEEPLYPWIFRRETWPAMQQKGPIRTSKIFPGPQAPAYKGAGDLTISSNMDFDITKVQDYWNADGGWYTQYFYQIDYRGLILDMQGRFENNVPNLEQAIEVAGIYPGSCPSAVGVITPGNSIIDNGSMTYYHDAWDYKVGAITGCQTCGGAAGSGAGSVDLALGRIHRYRDLDWGASFGPGVLSNHDLRLHLFAENNTLVGRFFDPLQRTVCELSANQGSAVLHDARSVTIGLTILAIDGSPTSDVAQANRAILQLQDNRTLTFELFPMQYGDDSALYGRVVRVEDRSNNRLVYYYMDTDARAALNEPTVDVSSLWRFNRIIDQRGVQAQFTWSAAIGQWVIDQATMPGGGVFTYAYGNNGIVSLSDVSYPTGEQSSFALGWNKDEQWVSITFNDAGAEGSHRRKTAYLTPSIEVNVAGGVYGQLPNLIRQVENGSGELSYRNWPEAHNNILDFYVLTGGGKDGSGVLKWLQYKDGLPVSSKTAVQYFPGQAFAIHEWQIDSEYTTDEHMRPQQMRDPTGVYTTYERDSRGNITVKEYRRPDGSLISRTTTTWNDRNDPVLVTDALGRQTLNTYDPVSGLLTHRTVALGTDDEATWENKYDAQGRLSRSIDANGNGTDYKYDPNTNLLSSVSEPADFPGTPEDERPTRHFTYDAAGRLETSIDASGHVVSYDYDGRGRPTTVTYDDGSYEEMVYGTGINANLITRQKDRNGNWVELDYDATGRTITSILNEGQPDQLVRSWSYVPGKDLVAAEIVNGKRMDYEYDGRNRKVGTTSYADINTSYTQHLDIWEEYNVTITTDDQGRRTFSLASIDRLRSRVVSELIPGAITVTGNPETVTASLWALPRGTDENAGWVISDSSTDVAGQLTSQVDARGVSSSFSYDNQGRTAGEISGDILPDGSINPDAVKMAYAYDDEGNRTVTHHPRSFVRLEDGTFAPNPDGQFMTTTSYTARNLVASVTEAAGTPDAATVSYTYSPIGQKETETDPRNPAWKTTYIYDSCCGRVTGIKDAQGHITYVTTDPNGNRTSSTDALGHGTSTIYDSQNRPVRMENSEGEVSELIFDDDLTDGVGIDADYPTVVAGLGFGQGSTGSAVLSINSAQERALKIMDSIGRTRRTMDTAGQVTTFAYLNVNDGLQEVTVTDSLGRVMRQRLDAAGRVWSEVDADGHETHTTYDAQGNVLSVRDANGIGWDAEYDSLNRIIKRTDTAGVVTRTEYDAQGNPIAMYDGLGNAVRVTYDARNRKITEQERIDIEPTQFGYDKMGRLVSVIDAEGHETTYTYDERGLLVAETYPMGQQTSTSEDADKRTYTYDAARRLETRTDQNGVVTTYEYDDANRQKVRRTSNGDVDNFDYDAAGRLITATNSRYGTTIRRFYDAAGRLDYEEQDLGDQSLTVRYAYDVLNRPTHVTYPDGQVVARTYTTRGQLQQVWHDGTSAVLREYDKSGRLVTAKFGNGLAETRTYQPGDMLIASQRVAASPTALIAAMSLAYEVDDNKRKTAQNDHLLPNHNQVFGYDNADRLTSWSAGSDNRGWDLSPVGDWTTYTRNGVVQEREHTDVHEVTRLTTGSASIDLLYDANGNLIQDHLGSQFNYDAENRLAQAQIYDDNVGVKGTATYRYDAFGRRLQKTVFGRTTTYAHDGEQVIQETDGVARLTRDIPEEEDGELNGSPAGGAVIPDALVRVNFQPPKYGIPDGFVADKGRLLGTRTNGYTYGWDSDRTTNTRVYDVHPYPQFDTQQRVGEGDAPADAGTWRIALPNGQYAVAVVMGDPVSRDQTNHLLINGEEFVDNDPATVAPVSSSAQQGDFDGYVTTAIISDGYLTLKIPASVNSIQSRNPRLCFIEIGPEGSSVDQALRDRLVDIVDQANKLTAGQWRTIRPQRTYVYGSYIDEPVMLAIGPKENLQRYWLHSDHVYSVNVVTDASGAPVERYAYDAYGKRTIYTGDGTQERSQSAVFNDVGFTGRWHDEETGLQFFRARYFSSELGRFISRDSAGYVNGYGLYGAYFVPNAMDPSGNQAECDEDNFNLSNEDLEFLSFINELLYADNFGLFDQHASVMQSAMVAGRYLGLNPQQIWQMGQEWNEISSFAGDVALSPMFFISEQYASARDQAFNSYQENLRYHTVMSEFSYAISDVFVSGALDWSIGAVTGGFGAFAVQGFRYSKLVAQGAKSEQHFAKLQAKLHPARVTRNQRSGNAARDFIASREGGIVDKEVVFNLPGNRIRRVDVLAQNDKIIAIESKVGRTSRDSRIRQELARDIELLRRGMVDQVRWEFFRSATTGKIGMTGPLLKTVTRLIEKLQRRGLDLNVVYNITRSF